MIDNTKCPLLPLELLTPAQLRDAATYWRAHADATTDDDIEAMRAVAGDDAADTMERSREACRQEAAVCAMLAGLAAA